MGERVNRLSKEKARVSPGFLFAHRNADYFFFFGMYRSVMVPS